jgi:uncharacterized membrane protein
VRDADLDDLNARVAALEAAVAELGREAGASAAAGPATPPVPAASGVRKRLPDASTAPAAKRHAPHDVESLVGTRGLLYVGSFLIAIGVASFLKIAFDRGWIGPPMRVALGVIAGVALIALGSGLRKRVHPYFADALIGLGAVLEYLSLYSAGVTFALLPATVVALGMIVVTGTSCVLAYRDDRESLAYLGTLGGLLTPLLLGSQTPDLGVLFTYLAVLAAGAIVLGELRGWRGIPLVSLIGTVLYWLAFGLDFNNGTAPTGERLAIALVLYGLFSSSAIAAWRARTPPDGWRIAMAAINAAWFFLGVSSLAFDDRTLLAIVFLAVAAAHVAVGSYARQRMQFWLATIALSFAIPPICYAFSAWVPQDVLVTTMHLAWIGEAILVGVLGSRWRDPALLILSGALFATVLLHTLLYNQESARWLFNERFVSLAATAAGLLVWRRTLAAQRIANAQGSSVLRVLVDVLAIVAISPEARRLGELVQPHSVAAAGNVALSIFWALYGGALVVAGIRFKNTVSRWEGLALLGLTVMKAFAVDLTDLDFVFRVVSALGLGIVLLVLAYLYQRRLRSPLPEEAP